MSDTPEAVLRRAEIWANFETCSPKNDTDEHYNLAVLFARALCARPEALRIDDVGAVAWAYRKLKAFGVHTGTIDSAMMMDRLNAILTTECPGTQASSVGAVPAPSAPSPLARRQDTSSVEPSTVCTAMTLDPNHPAWGAKK